MTGRSLANAIAQWAVAVMLAAVGAHGYEMQPGKAALSINGREILLRAQEGGAFASMRLPDGPADLVKVSQDDGDLVVDTREYFWRHKTGPAIMIGWFGIPVGQWHCTPEGRAVSGKINRMEVTAGGDDGLSLGLLVLSNKGTAFYDGKDFLISGTGSGGKLVFEPSIPEGVEGLWLRADLKSPGVYRFRDVRFFAYEPEQEKEEGVSANLIRNGGAEDGFYNIFMPSLAFAQRDAVQKYFDWRGIEIKSELAAELDDKVVHSGRYSFRLTASHDDVYSRFHFNPVAYAVGKPISYTVWMKAEKPMDVEIGFFIANALAAFKYFRIDTEWRKYELYMPAWGEKADLAFQNGLVGAYGCVTGVAYPYVRACDKNRGTFWVDSAACVTGGHADFADDDKVHMRPSLGIRRGYCYAGEEIRLSLEVESYAEQAMSCEVSWSLKDWRGKEVASSGPMAIELDPGERRSLDFRLVPPPRIRGAMNLTFSCKAGGRDKEATLHLGVIDRGQAPVDRFGVEFPVGGNNVKLNLPYLRDLRVGGVRIGTASGRIGDAFDAAPFFDGTGIKPLLCLSMEKEVRDNPEKWAEWMKEFEKQVRKVAGSVEIYESENEVNVVSGWNVDLDMKQLRELSEILKRSDPQAKLAGPCTLTIDYTWIENILKKGGKDLLDYVSYHPYQPLPELPDYAANAAKLQELIDCYKPIPQIATEAGRVQSSGLTDNTITEYTREAAAGDMRNIIQGIAGGARRYYHFAYESSTVSNAWNMMLMTDPSNDRFPIPNLAFFAMRNLIDRLEKAPYAGRARLGLNYRCYIFDHGHKRTAVLWKWRGEPSVMRLGADSLLAAYDFCGSRIDAGEIGIDIFPVYLDSQLPADRFAEVLENAAMTDVSGKSVEVTPSVIGINKVKITVRNVTGRSLGCRIKVLTAGAVDGSAEYRLDAIGGEGSKDLEITLRDNITVADRKVRVLVEVDGRDERHEMEWNLRAIIARRTARALAIDGDLSDWPEGTEVIRLDKRNRDPRVGRNWSEAEDRITANLRYAWDDDFLYISAEVFKPELFTLPDLADADRLWEYDGLQVCFDTLRNGSADISGIDDDDFEYSMGMASGRPVVFRRWGSTAKYDSLSKTTGVLPEGEEVVFAVRKFPGRVVYEAAFSRRAVSPFKLVRNAAMRIGCIVNVNNGKERAGALELTPGVAYDKCPGMWMDMVLLP